MTEQDTGLLPSEHPRLRQIVTILILFVGIGFSTAMLVGVLIEAFEQNVFAAVVRDHFAAAFGVPVSMMTALVLVIMLRVIVGPIEFKAGGVEFKGASAPIVMWILCFLSLAGALRMLWGEP